MYKHINIGPGDVILTISDTFEAILSMIDTGTVIVQLESKEEADKLVEEVNDGDELCHKDGSIMGKYTEFHKFHP